MLSSLLIGLPTFGIVHAVQEVTVRGQDVVFKDVIEPLENVSVAVFATDKQSVTDLGPAQQVRRKLESAMQQNSLRKWITAYQKILICAAFTTSHVTLITTVKPVSIEVFMCPGFLCRVGVTQSVTPLRLHPLSTRSSLSKLKPCSLLCGRLRSLLSTPSLPDPTRRRSSWR